MAVQIQDVLTLLPEFFPGVQQIPYANVYPNPDNPGAPLTDPEIQELADNLADRGLVNPLKVQPDPVNPLAGGVKPHTDNPRLTAEGRPWVLGDFNFQILAGERRYRAAGRLGWASLPGFILNPTAEEAVEITHLDNDVRDRGWWAGYQSIEQLVKANPSLTQRQVGIRLKLDSGKVNRALGLLPLLNPAARGLIVANCNNSNKGIRGISESAVLRLADLGPASTLKPGVKKAGEDAQKLWPYPAITPETQDRVLRTLKVAIDRELTESGVRGLVGWVQDGHQPEDFPGPGQDKTKPKKGVLDQAVYKQVPVDRIRVHQIVDVVKPHPVEVERKALSMQAIGHATEILVRTLSEEEKKADPDHDYELFEGKLTLVGAQKLGWPLLNAVVYAINADEALRIYVINKRFSSPLTWIDIYGGIEKMLGKFPEKTVAQLAIELQEDPALASKVFLSMKLLNENTRKAIAKSVYQCKEGLVDMGGYRFAQEFAVPLKRLQGVSKNLSETQELVERVVEVAIQNEARSEAVEGLVDWVLAGNDPDEYFEKEALRLESPMGDKEKRLQ